MLDLDVGQSNESVHVKQTVKSGQNHLMNTDVINNSDYGSCSQAEASGAQAQQKENDQNECRNLSLE